MGGFDLLEDIDQDNIPEMIIYGNKDRCTKEQLIFLY